MMDSNQFLKSSTSLCNKLEIFTHILGNLVFKNPQKKDNLILKDASLKKIKDKIVFLDREKIQGGVAHGVGSFQQFLVQSYYGRSKNIYYEDLQRWFKDSEHGFIHGIFCFFIYLWMGGYLIEENKSVEKISSINLEMVDILQSCLFHDFYRVYEDQDHDKKLRQIFLNLLPETYNHSNPNLEEENCPLIKADRVELFRFDDGEKFINMEMIDKNFYESNKLEIELLYRYFRKYIDKAWNNNEHMWCYHHVEAFEKWSGVVKKYPQRNCLESLNLYCVNVRKISKIDVICNKNLSGIIPINKLNSKPIFLNRDHPSLSNEELNNTEDFIFLIKYTEEKKQELMKAYDMGIVAMDSICMKNFLECLNMMRGMIEINTFYRG